MSESQNDDMVFINPFGREVTVPNELGQELILQDGFKPVNKEAKEALKDPSSLIFTSLEKSSSDENPAKVTEDIKTGVVTPEPKPLDDAVTPAADLPKGDAASEGHVEESKPKKRGSK